MQNYTTNISPKLEDLDPKEYILIKNARVNNLKNLSVAIPRNKMVVITGLSGSGKSSLAFDTLFAEGQRMYVESLSSYARQFLGRMEKPEVDYIKGVSPAISIEQRVNTNNPRSTVGTTTEIYDYLKLLYARIGKTISPKSGKEVSSDSVSDVIDYLISFKEGERYMITSPHALNKNRTVEEELNTLLGKGYSRLIIKEKPIYIEDLIEDVSKLKNKPMELLIDRGAIAHDEDSQYRMADSVQTALFEGDGVCNVHIIGKETKSFSDKFERDDILFERPSVNFFSFNNPFGACKRCEGFGNILGIDPDLIIPDKSLSIYEGAIAPWRSETMKKWIVPLINEAPTLDFPIHRPIQDLTSEEYEMLWEGKGKFKGLNKFIKFLEARTIKIQYRVMLSRYRGRTVCSDCKGTRLRKDAAYVQVAGKSIVDMVLMQVDELNSFFKTIQLSNHAYEISKRIVLEVQSRLGYLNKVGLGYLTLNRKTATLSGGEYQRIKLSTSLGSVLVGAMYILDEPSIGLHPKDTQKMVEVLNELKAKGNTVIVVEHEEEVMKAADQIIDIGPDAGVHGGELVFQGSMDDIAQGDTHTTRYLSGRDMIVVPDRRRTWNKSVKITGARENNLKNVSVDFPLGVLTAITGVSGSGKSTLVTKILYPALGKILGTVNIATGKFDQLSGDYKEVSQIEFVDQNPIGKSSRSNPVTYVKAYDAIRQLFANQQLSKQRGYKPAHFSFNVDGGRCETCSGEGSVKIEMQFMADIVLDCEQCKGQRFKRELLEVNYNHKNISEVLNLTIDEALEFFSEVTPVHKKLLPLAEVGLGYVTLGQSSSSLSGGEAQRVKLASFLGKGKSGNQNILFIFDEPTTGLHFHDISKLLKAMNALIAQGNTVLVIEHNVEIVKSADWVIDLGPEGGANGGQVSFAGLPEDLATEKGNHTGAFLKDKLVR
ncbi:MAG: excinuclease ABC subunit UvrA [Cyclobacteriaceae bacterium]|nr:excinuclease ABC subunit UvrA [Cyclobacteriaceae bacterium]